MTPMTLSFKNALSRYGGTPLKIWLQLLAHAMQFGLRLLSGNATHLDRDELYRLMITWELAEPKLETAHFPISVRAVAQPLALAWVIPLWRELTGDTETQFLIIDYLSDPSGELHACVSGERFSARIDDSTIVYFFLDDDLKVMHRIWCDIVDKAELS